MEELTRANREGDFRYDVLYQAQEWKGFDFNSTPQFFFVRNGKIEYAIKSGKTAEFKARLAEGLAKIGLR
jgi:hypothetical protein